MKVFQILFFCCLFFPAASQQKTDTIRVGYSFKNMNRLQPSTSEYMHYFQRGDSVFNITIQRRVISRRTVDEKDMWVVHDRKQGANTNWDAVSYLDAGDFRPYKVLRKVRDSVEAYTFIGNKVEATAGTERNRAARFSREAGFDLFNFETDTEMFRLLPLKRDYRVAIPFYHPGSKAPFQYTLYEVVGEEQMLLIGSVKIDCWKLKFHSNPSAILWLDKKTQQLVKQVFEFPNGMKAVKILTYESFLRS